jgi:hypothetical protein
MRSRPWQGVLSGDKNIRRGGTHEYGWMDSLGKEQTMLATSSGWSRWRIRVAAVFLATLLCASGSFAYSVLTHEEIVDLAWTDELRPLLLQRFPELTEEQITEAHAIRHFTVVSIGALAFLLVTVLSSGQTPSTTLSPVNEPSTKPPAIVIGFVGGFIAHDNLAHSEVQLAARLRKEYPAGVDVETYESYRGTKAEREILKLLDANHDGILTAEEKQNARIIIYGHSWGGAESITLARALEKHGISVLLTLQVDSVSRFGSNDILIPANVAQAANFYQPHGILHGDHDIRAADPAHTRIIGNFKYDYEASPLKCSGYPWYDRILVKPHTQIECDPIIWTRVESLIRASLPPMTPDGEAQ